MCDEEEVKRYFENQGISVSVEMFDGIIEEMCIYYKYHLLKNNRNVNCNSLVDELEYYKNELRGAELRYQKVMLLVLMVLMIVAKCKKSGRNILNVTNAEYVSQIVDFFKSSFNLIFESSIESPVNDLVKQEIRDMQSNVLDYVYLSLNEINVSVNESINENINESINGDISMSPLSLNSAEFGSAEMFDDCYKVNERVIGIIEGIEDEDMQGIDNVLESFITGGKVLMLTKEKCPNELQQKTIERYIKLYEVLDMIYYDNDINSSKYRDEYRRTQRDVIPELRKFFKEREYEEDSEEFSDNFSIADVPTDANGKCGNVSLVMGEEYDEKSNDTVKLYLLSSNNTRFAENAICISKDEMRQYLQTDKNTVPSNIMSLWRGGEVNGVGGKPSYKMVVKVPPNNVYVTLGTFIRIMHETHTKLYLIPLYGGKRRRIGNIEGIIGVSMNHGQIPGSIIYKGYTKEELKNPIKVKETSRDYPLLFNRKTQRNKEITLQSEMKIIGNEIIDYLISEW